MQCATYTEGTFKVNKSGRAKGPNGSKVFIISSGAKTLLLATKIGYIYVFQYLEQLRKYAKGYTPKLYT